MSHDEIDILDELLIDENLSDWEDFEPIESTAIIAALGRQGETLEQINDSLDELERLADTAEITIYGRSVQRRGKPDRGNFFGTGFIEELKQKLVNSRAQMLIINEELSPMQARNLTKLLEVEVVDRTEIILSIFHKHAKTKEAKLQVKLAELEYQLPRLRRLWGHFDREHGAARSKGGSASRGMGEKQIEIDRRLIKRNITRIEHVLTQIIKQKETQRKQRTKTKKICLVGYTNAGKSTLFNALTNAGVLVEDKLFATLDSTSRQLKLDWGFPIVISDTVGFISNLPHHLIASFQATLMEVLNADLLLHIVDSSDKNYLQNIEQVEKVLLEIHADHIPSILVLNKIDQVDHLWQNILSSSIPNAVQISALMNTNLESLTSLIEKKLFSLQTMNLLIPYTQGKFVALVHEIAEIISESYTEQGTMLEVRLDAENLYQFKDFIVSE